MKNRGVIVALGIVGLLLLFGTGGLALYRRLSRKENAEALRAAARRYGLNPEWLVAVGIVESNLNNQATNLVVSDLGRGGAFGPTQITLQTAREHGFTGPASDLTNPAIAANLTGKIIAAGRPTRLEDVGAWWNAGKRSADMLRADHVTKTDYIPKLRQALTKTGLV